MIAIEKTIVSDDIADKHFVCDLKKCQGKCCRSGDFGAPLEEPEVAKLKDNLGELKPYLSSSSLQTITQQGTSIKLPDQKFLTPTRKSGECVYSFYSNDGSLKCAIEKAFYEGKTNFPKPISCQLYPIRITKYEDFDAVNYHKWKICNPACRLGDKLGIPIYKFVKKALIRKYGKVWYKKLVDQIENTNQPDVPLSR